MEESKTQSLTPPTPPIPFNGWAAYGWMWVFAVVRMLQRTVCEREAEIAWHIQEKNDELALLRAAHHEEVTRLRETHAEVMAQLRFEKGEQLHQLAEENRGLLNRLLKRQSTEPLPEVGQEQASVSSNGHPPTRLQFKPPIASLNAEARAAEIARHQQAAETRKREAIRLDAERSESSNGHG